MKNESEFCTVIKNSMVAGYKIPDESGFQYGAHTAIRCFDGIGMLPSNIFGGNPNNLTFTCWEAKYIKSPGAIALTRLEPHQDFYLREYRKAEGVKSLAIIGMDYGRADKRVYIFDWDENFGDLYKIHFSIHLKELDKLPYNKISKGTFSFDNIITYDMLKSIYPDFEKVYNTFKEKLEQKNGKSEL